MKKRHLLIGFGLLALPVVLLCIVFQKQLAHTWKEVVSLTSNNPHEYRSRTLKRPVSFTNQMFLSPEDFAHRNKAPNGRSIKTSFNYDIWSFPVGPFLPYSMELLWWFSFSIDSSNSIWPDFSLPKLSFDDCYFSRVKDLRNRLVRYGPNWEPIDWDGTLVVPKENYPPHLVELFPEWPQSKMVEIELNPKVKLTLNSNILTVTNTGSDRVMLSKNSLHAFLNLIIDENGGIWFIEELDYHWGCMFYPGDLKPIDYRPKHVRNTLEKRQFEERRLLSQAEQMVGKRFRPVSPSDAIEPLESYIFELPRITRPDGIDAKLKCSVFFVILGENDKIIHIFETPCEK